MERGPSNRIIGKCQAQARFLFFIYFWVKFPEFEPKECQEFKKTTALSLVASRNLVTQPFLNLGQVAKRSKSSLT